MRHRRNKLRSGQIYAIIHLVQNWQTYSYRRANEFILTQLRLVRKNDDNKTSD